MLQQSSPRIFYRDTEQRMRKRVRIGNFSEIKKLRKIQTNNLKNVGTFQKMSKNSRKNWKIHKKIGKFRKIWIFIGIPFHRVHPNFVVKNSQQYISIIRWKTWKNHEICNFIEFNNSLELSKNTCSINIDDIFFLCICILNSKIEMLIPTLNLMWFFVNQTGKHNWKLKIEKHTQKHMQMVMSQFPFYSTQLVKFNEYQFDTIKKISSIDAFESDSLFFILFAGNEIIDLITQENDIYSENVQRITVDTDWADGLISR